MSAGRDRTVGAGQVSLRRAAPGKCTGPPAHVPTRLTSKINGYTATTRAGAASEDEMELNENARIDTSQIDDQRSSGGGGGGIGGLPIGGGGLAGIVVTVLIAVVGGFLGINNLTGDSGGGTQTGDNTSLTQKCSQASGREQLDCRN